MEVAASAPPTARQRLPMTMPSSPSNTTLPEYEGGVRIRLHLRNKPMLSLSRSKAARQALLDSLGDQRVVVVDQTNHLVGVVGVSSFAALESIVRRSIADQVSMSPRRAARSSCRRRSCQKHSRP